VIYSPRYYAALEQRVHPFAVPKDQLDLLTADAATLAPFGVPPPPDPVGMPELHAFWRKLVSPPFEFVVPQFPTPPRTDEFRTLEFRFGRPGAGLPPNFSTNGHRETSRNWSGAYITPMRPDRFNMAVGSWVVPAIVPPAVMPEGGPGNGIFRSSAWIGIDGHRSRYPHASLPQIGTSHYIDPTKSPNPIYGAWIEWWKYNPNGASDPESKPKPIQNFPVAPGDEILAGMIVTVSSDVHFFLKNQRTGLFTAALVIAPGAIDPLGTTAEWIFERPTDPDNMIMDLLPNYGVVDFKNCLAISGPNRTTYKRLQSLNGNARFINMRETFPGPHRSAPVSIASKINATTTRVRFREPGGIS
jgi:Peptidase A4 family